MRVDIVPKTLSGKWSVGLVGAFFLFIFIFAMLVVSGQRGGETFFSNLSLTVPMLIAAASGIAALVTGIVGVLKSRERAVLVYFAIFVGLIVLLWGLAEVISPH
jgi:hypothetical protein